MQVIQSAISLMRCTQHFYLRFSPHITIRAISSDGQHHKNELGHMQILLCDVCLKARSSTTFTHGTQALPNQQQTWNAILGWNVVPENTQGLTSGILFIFFCFSTRIQ